MYTQRLKEASIFRPSISFLPRRRSPRHAELIYEKRRRKSKNCDPGRLSGIMPGIMRLTWMNHTDLDEV